MSTQIEINGSSLISIKDAAKRVSYSRDYVVRLAREQKIVASQIGRQWFVDLSSLQNFAKSVELEQSVRKQSLSHERKRERAVKLELDALHSNVESIKHKSRTHSLVAVALVLTFGLFSGIALQETSLVTTSELPNIKNISATVSYPSVENVKESLPEIVEPQAATLYTTVMEYPLFVDESKVRPMKNNPEGVFVLANEGVVRSELEVEALFSDDVQVEFIGNNDGVISLEREGGEVVEYPFVSVPANTDFVEVIVNEDII
jgi:excisionase family DNA binding protein